MYRCSLSTALAAEPEVDRPPARRRQRDRPADESLGQSKLRLETIGGRAASSPTAKLMWIELPAAPAADKATIWIELLDGSRAAAAWLHGRRRARPVSTWLPGQTLEIPTRAIHAVRFRQQTPELAAQWREITSSKATGDMVVIRKTSMRTIEQGENEPRTVTEQALDQLEGTLLDVTRRQRAVSRSTAKKFPSAAKSWKALSITIPAKREFSPPRLPADRCGRLDLAASRAVSLTDGRLDADDVRQCCARACRSRPLPKLDFSVGNVAFLSDLEADSGSGRAAVSLQPAAMTHKFSRMFQVRSRPAAGRRRLSHRAASGLTTACRCTARRSSSIACPKAFASSRGRRRR